MPVDQQYIGHYRVFAGSQFKKKVSDSCLSPSSQHFGTCPDKNPSISAWCQTDASLAGPTFQPQQAHVDSLNVDLSHRGLCAAPCPKSPPVSPGLLYLSPGKATPSVTQLPKCFHLHPHSCSILSLSVIRDTSGTQSVVLYSNIQVWQLQFLILAI